AHRRHSLYDHDPRWNILVRLPLALRERLLKAACCLLPGGVITRCGLIGELTEAEIQHTQGLDARRVELLQHVSSLGDGHAANGDQCPDQAQPPYVRLSVRGALDLLAAPPRLQVITDVVLYSGHRDYRSLALCT